MSPALRQTPLLQTLSPCPPHVIPILQWFRVLLVVDSAALVAHQLVGHMSSDTDAEVVDLGDCRSEHPRRGVLPLLFEHGLPTVPFALAIRVHQAVAQSIVRLKGRCRECQSVPFVNRLPQRLTFVQQISILLTRTTNRSRPLETNFGRCFGSRKNSAQLNNSIPSRDSFTCRDPPIFRRASARFL